MKALQYTCRGSRKEERGTGTRCRRVAASTHTRTRDIYLFTQCQRHRQDQDINPAAMCENPPFGYLDPSTLCFTAPRRSIPNMPNNRMAIVVDGEMYGEGEPDRIKPYEETICEEEEEEEESEEGSDEAEECYEGTARQGLAYGRRAHARAGNEQARYPGSGSEGGSEIDSEPQDDVEEEEEVGEGEAQNKLPHAGTSRQSASQQNAPQGPIIYGGETTIDSSSSPEGSTTPAMATTYFNSILPDLEDLLGELAPSGWSVVVLKGDSEFDQRINITTYNRFIRAHRQRVKDLVRGRVHQTLGDEFKVEVDFATGRVIGTSSVCEV
jgi:hypothetical protein